MHTPRDTAEIRAKMLDLWKQIDEKKISASEIRLHIGVARVILDTIKVEIAMAHLNRVEIPTVPIQQDFGSVRHPIKRSSRMSEQ